MTVEQIQAEYEYQENKHKEQEGGRVNVFDLSARWRREARDKALAEAKQREKEAEERAEERRVQADAKFLAEKIEPIKRAYLANGGTPAGWAKIAASVTEEERLSEARKQTAPMYRDL